MMATNSIRDGNPVQVLRIANLAKHYDDEPAIADATFSVIPGEVLGVVGPHGAGKTTVVARLACLPAAASGTVLCPERAVPPARERAGARCHSPGPTAR